MMDEKPHKKKKNLENENQDLALITVDERSPGIFDVYRLDLETGKKKEKKEERRRKGEKKREERERTEREREKKRLTLFFFSKTTPQN